MRAVRFHDYGAEDVLTVDEVPEPAISPDEVLVRVHSCAVNHLDLDFRAGVSRIQLTLPHILGMDDHRVDLGHTGRNTYRARPRGT